MTAIAGRSRGWTLILPALSLLIIGFLLPTIIMFVLSLRTYSGLEGIGHSWTLSNYVDVLSDVFYLSIIGRTLVLGLVVTIVSLLIGFPLALFIVRANERLQTIALLFVVFPLLLNVVVRSFGWIVLLAPHGLINETLMKLSLIRQPLDLMYNLTGVLIGLVQVFLPFMVLLLVPALQNVPRDVGAAAYTLHASRPRVFFSITIPLALPGIVTGSILVFVLAISALVTPRMLGGPTYRVMATQIYSEFVTDLDWPSGAALSFILTLLALFLIWGANRIASRWMRGISG